MFQPHFEAFRPERGFGQGLELARRLLSYRTPVPVCLTGEGLWSGQLLQQRVLAYSSSRCVSQTVTDSALKGKIVAQMSSQLEGRQNDGVDSSVHSGAGFYNGSQF